MKNLCENILHSAEVECDFQSLSEVISERKLKKIDLLKIDVEGAEIAILNGIKQEHVAIIKYIIVEVEESKKAPVLKKLAGMKFSITEMKKSSYGEYHFLVIKANNDRYTINKQSDYSKKLIQPSYLYSEETFIELIKQSLNKVLPSYMIPSVIQVYPEKRLTNSNKHSLLTLEAPKFANNIVNEKENIIDEVRQIFSQVLNVNTVAIDKAFFEMGGNSLLLVDLYDKISRKFSLSSDFTLVNLLQYPTVKLLSSYLSNRYNTDKTAMIGTKDSSIRSANKFVAIIGVSGKYPQSENIDEFWQLLNKEHDLINRNSEDLDSDSQKFICTNAGIVPTYKLFDEEFFGYTPREAKLMDPQHRLLLEETYKAFNSAGYAPSKIVRDVGVFIGSGKSRYEQHDGKELQDINEEISNDIFNEKDYAATKISYKLNFRGPSLNINTACSSSLVSIITACNSLKNNECDFAVAGGAFLVLPDRMKIKLAENSTVSRTGFCKPFDQSADGILAGSAVGVVLLKRYEAAVTDGDNILAVIKGYGINNDGSDKIGFTAPSIEGQVKCLQKAIKNAQINVNEIDYIECHGTGTKLGDEVELSALEKIFSEHEVYIGSVKSNIGHCDAASGFAGLSKGLMILNQRVIPPMPNYNTPCNKLEGSKLKVNTNAIKLPYDRTITIGVSSFGIGGTNAHIILSSSPVVNHQDSISAIDCILIFPFSANSAESLLKLIQAYKSKLLALPCDLQALAKTLQFGADTFANKVVFIAADLEELLLEMDKFTPLQNCYASAEYQKEIKLAQQWLVEEIPWPIITQSKIHHRVPLIAYPFKQNPHWDIKEDKNSSFEKQQLSVNTYNFEQVQTLVLSLFSEATEQESLTLESDFFMIGGESFSALELISKIINLFHVEFSLDLFYELRTVNAVANKVFSHLQDSPVVIKNNHIQLICAQKRSETTNIIFMSPVSGMSFCYKEIVSSINANSSVYMGVNNNLEVTLEPLDLDILAQSFINKIIAANLKDIYFIGWSYGGNLSYKIASILYKERPELLKAVVLIDSWATYNQKYKDPLLHKNLIENYRLNKSADYIEQWNDIIWRRTQILLNEVPSYTSFPLYLLKATQILEEYQVIENPLNNWHLFNQRVKVTLIEGDHMSIMKNVKCISEALIKIIT